MSSYDDIIDKRRAAEPEDVEPDAHLSGAGDAGARTAVPDGGQPGTVQAQEQPRRYMTYADIRDELARQDEIMRRNRPETDEERQKRERRERRDKVLGALGDGISALSNLYFTTRGAPNMYNPSTSLSEAARKRIEMARQAREKERAAYNAAATARYATLTDADSRAYRWDTLARQKQLDAEGKARKDALADAQVGKYKAAQAKDEAQVAYYNKKIDLLERGFSVEQAEKMARIDKLNAEADEARRRGTSSWVGGSGSGGRKSYGTFLGTPYATGADYKKAVTDYAVKAEIPLTYDRHSSSKNKYDETTEGTTQTYRPIEEVAAECEAHYRSEHASKPAKNSTPKPAAPKPAARPAQKGTPKAAKSYKNTRALGL